MSSSNISTRSQLILEIAIEEEEIKRSIKITDLIARVFEILICLKNDVKACIARCIAAYKSLSNFNNYESLSVHIVLSGSPGSLL